MPRPLTQRADEFLEAIAQDRRSPPRPDQVGHTRDLLEAASRRLGSIEGRQDFAEILLENQPTESDGAAPHVAR
jgi:hypothetical protein